MSNWRSLLPPAPILSLSPSYTHTHTQLFGEDKHDLLIFCNFSILFPPYVCKQNLICWTVTSTATCFWRRSKVLSPEDELFSVNLLPLIGWELSFLYPGVDVLLRKKHNSVLKYPMFGFFTCWGGSRRLQDLWFK